MTGGQPTVAPGKGHPTLATPPPSPPTALAATAGTSATAAAAAAAIASPPNPKALHSQLPPPPPGRAAISARSHVLPAKTTVTVSLSV